MLQKKEKKKKKKIMKMMMMMRKVNQLANLLERFKFIQLFKQYKYSDDEDDMQINAKILRPLGIPEKREIIINDCEKEIKRFK